MSDARFIPLADLPREGELAFKTWAASHLMPHSPSPTPDDYARGLAEGQELAAAAFESERERLQQLIAAATALQPIEPDSVKTLVFETVLRLVRDIVGASPVDAELLKRQVDDAIASAGYLTDTVLRVSPTDLGLLQSAAIAIPLIEDTQLLPGNLRVESGSGMIEHGRAVQIDALRAQLGLAGGD